MEFVRNRRGVKMESIQGKHFSITDPEGVKTVIYRINKTAKEYLKEYPKWYGGYTRKKLDSDLIDFLNRSPYRAIVLKSLENLVHII